MACVGWALLKEEEELMPAKDLRRDPSFQEVFITMLYSDDNDKTFLQVNYSIEDHLVTR